MTKQSARILVIEDEPRIAQFLMNGLGRAFDAILLDLTVPSRVRSEPKHLTASASLMDGHDPRRDPGDGSLHPGNRGHRQPHNDSSRSHSARRATRGRSSAPKRPPEPMGSRPLYGQMKANPGARRALRTVDPSQRRHAITRPEWTRSDRGGADLDD